MSSDPLSYFSIQELYLTFNDSKRISKHLQLIAGSTNRTVTRNRKDGFTHCWILDPVMNIPSGEDLTVKPRYSIPRRQFYSINELVVTREELLDGSNDNSTTKQGSDYNLEIVATAHGISDVNLVDIPSVSDLPLSLEDIQKGIRDLESVLSYVGDKTDVLDGIMAALHHLGNVHPIANAVVTAISIPYKLLENERRFNKDLKSLGDVMRTLVLYLTEVEHVANISLVKENFKEILEAVLQGSSFIQLHLKKSHLRQIADAQFISGLNDLKSKFSNLRDNFKDVIACQVAVGVGALVNASRFKDALKPVPLANLGERCMGGTRVDQLATIQAWIKDTERPNIFFIYGSPGAGKSTLSSTLASEISHCTRFFFRRDEANRRDPVLVWPTVAFELANVDRNMEKAMTDILETKMPRPHDADVEEQFETLIKEALTNAGQRRPVAPFVLVLDALDECSQDVEQWPNFLQTLRRWSELPRSFKLIVTSRNDSTIHSTLDSVSEQIQLLSGVDVDTTTSKDIECFIVARCQHISSRFPLSLSSTWPGSLKIQQLVDYAAGLFILAKMMLEWIGDGDPQDRLTRIGDNLGKAEANLDTLYHQILIAATDRLSENELNGFTTALSAIILAKDPLSLDDLKTLFQLPDSLTELVMRKLAVVVSTQSSHLQVRHNSFSDFLLDPKRSERFTIDREMQSVVFANACLRHMNARLEFNMFAAKTSHCFNKDIPHYDEICRSIPTSLIHSTYYWAEYLEGLLAKPSHGLTELTELERFLYNHMLHWLEVLSLKKVVHLAPQLLMLASKYIRNCNKVLSEFARDGSRFVMTFEEPISQSLPHIYVSALPFAPMQSSVAMKMRPLFANSLSIVNGRMKNWPAILLRLEGHEGGVRSVAFSADGTHIVSGSEDNTIRVWDADTGKNTMEPLQGHEDVVCSVAFSVDGTRIVSGSNDKTIRVWDANTGKCLLEPLRGHEGIVFSVAFSVDGMRIVSGSSDKTIRVWDAHTGYRVVSPLCHDDWVLSAVFSIDGTRIVSGAFDGAICVWDADTGQSLMEPLRGHEEPVFSVAFSADGTRIVSGSYDKTIRVWDADTGKTMMEPLRGHEDAIWSVALSSDGTRIVSSSSDKTIRVWDVHTGKCMVKPLRHGGHEDKVLSVAFSTDGTRIVSGSSDKTIRMWDPDPSKSMMEPLRGHEGYDSSNTGRKLAQGPGHENCVQSVAFSPDGTRIVSGSNDNTIGVWDANTGQSLMEPLQGHQDVVCSVAFSADSTRIVSGSDDMTIRVWDANTGGSLMGPLRGHDNCVECVTFSPDGRRIVSGSSDKTIRLWDVQTGRSMKPLRGHEDRVWSVAFSGDSRCIVSSSEDKTIRVWDADTGKSMMEPLQGHKDCVQSVAFSADGTRILSGSHDGTVRVWDAETGKIVMEPLCGHEGRVLWDANTGKNLLEPLRGHESGIISVALSADGTRIVSGSFDHTIRVWDIDTSKGMMNPLCGHEGRIVSVAFSADGTRIVSGSDDSGKIDYIDAATQSCCFAFHDGRGIPAFCSHSKLEEDGWLYDANGNILFWVPQKNRAGLYYPQTTMVIGGEATQIDLSRFMHGEHWTEICSSVTKSTVMSR